MNSEFKILKAARLIDGYSNSAQVRAAILIEGETIR